MKLAMIVVAAALTAAIAGLRGADLVMRREQTLQAAERRAANLSLILSEYLREAFEAADTSIAHLVTLGRRIGGSTGPVEEWGPILSSVKAALPGIGSVSVADTEGTIRHSTIPEIIGQSRRTDYLFQHLSSVPTDVLIASTPFRAKVGRRSLMIPLGRRMTRADGTFDGIIVATFMPAEKRELFARVGVGAEGTLWVFHPDGQVLFREPSESNPIGESAAGNPIFEAARTSSSGAHRGLLFEGRPLYVSAFRRLVEPPLVVAVSLSEHEILEAWRREAAISVAALVVFALVLAGGLIVLFRQIDARSGAEAALARSQRLEAIGKLTGGVAHDFNNLLTVILGNADLMRMELENAPPSAVESLDEIEKAANRAAELTKRLLTFARRRPLQPQRVDLNEVVAAVKPMIARLLDESIQVKVDLHATPCFAFVDPVQTETAIVNLCVNARDAMPQGGLLSISTRFATLDEEYVRKHSGLAAGRYTMVTVSDTGTGIAPEVMSRIFEPFFTTKEPGRGTGLGLSIVHGFVKQSGGHVELYSELGHGTSVKLFFPDATETSGDAAPAPRAGAGERPRGAGEVILLVEDEAGVRKLAAATLKALGYRVLAAADGPAAVELMRDGPRIDLLFTDVVLPKGMDGRRLAEELGARQPGLRVLFASGYAEDIIQQQGRLQPGLRLLNKPYSGDELARAIRAALG